MLLFYQTQISIPVPTSCDIQRPLYVSSRGDSNLFCWPLRAPALTYTNTPIQMPMFFKADESRPAHARAPVTEWILIGAATTSTVLELTVKVRAPFVWQKEPSEKKTTAEVELAINEHTKGRTYRFSSAAPWDLAWAVID